MAEGNKNFQCSGDCLKCHANQRAYCASQFTYNSMRMIERMQGTLDSMQGTIDELRTKIDAIQGNEASLFDPTKEGSHTQVTPKVTCDLNDTAQGGGGAI